MNELGRISEGMVASCVWQHEVNDVLCHMVNRFENFSCWDGGSRWYYSLWNNAFHSARTLRTASSLQLHNKVFKFNLIKDQCGEGIK